MLKSIAQVKTFVNEVVNAESTAHILSNRGRNMRPLLTFVKLSMIEPVKKSL